MLINGQRQSSVFEIYFNEIDSNAILAHREKFNKRNISALRKVILDASYLCDNKHIQQQLN